jgi:hypothetical protein
LALIVLAVCIAAGCCYRLACILFAAGFTYVFLLDATNYQNHYYLIILLSWALAIVPANRAVSVDAAWRHRSPHAPREEMHHAERDAYDVAPAWSVWLLRFHIALPYFFGGVAKLDADWYSGAPIKQMLSGRTGLPIIGPWLSNDLAVSFFTWGGLLFDLSIVPLLLWKKSRPIAYILCVLFHLANSILFQIHVFPWFMIFATTIFFEPDWPRRVLGGRPLDLDSPKLTPWPTLSPLTRLGFALLAIYCVLHLWWPLRHQLYGPNVNWTERGHYFSWRMMLRNKVAGVRYYLTDPETGKTSNPDLRPYLNAEQAGKFSKDPEMILQLAHFLAAEHRRETGRPLEVRALVLTSLNGRKPQLYIDPNIDLAKQPRGFYPRPWLMPLTEPLRSDPWSLPLMEWEKHLELPPLPPEMQAADP